MDKYKETIGRYRIVYHEEHSDARKAEYRISGIDPDTLRVLYWSSNNVYDAEKEFAYCEKHAPGYKTYYLVDGAEETVELAVWL